MGAGGGAAVVRHEDDCLLQRRVQFGQQVENLVALLASRSPVGSSATISVGSVTIARAMPTRCCWPPESCPGRWRIRLLRPTSSSAVSTCWRRFAAEIGNRSSGSSTFSYARQDRQQVIELEDEANVPSPPAGQHALRHPRDQLVADPNLSLARPIQSGDQIQERRLSRPAGAHQRHELAVGHGERQVVEHIDLLAPAGEELVHADDAHAGNWGLDFGERSRTGTGGRGLRDRGAGLAGQSGAKRAVVHIAMAGVSESKNRSLVSPRTSATACASPVRCPQSPISSLSYKTTRPRPSPA